MSSDGNVNGGAGANSLLVTNKPFFCYQCNRTVTITIAPSDTSCPICHGGFLEEYENPIPNQASNFRNSNPFSHSSLSDLFSSILPLFTATNSSSPAYVDLESTGLFESTLAENDPNRYGTPPASKSAIDSLPSVKITKDHLSSKSKQCAVCMDDFEEGIQAKRMPCRHLYHKDCILLWLELHNSCPVCRHELPTDDPNYERRVRGAQGTNGGSDGADTGGSGWRSVGDNQTAERSFRISLPWPFQARASGSGSADNAETRQEDLD
ncbi:hypothetical protein GOBAR_DD26237 [Gossypium barbadense]|nr:hypothetical protein GOBAR_DD26237 [Gossypium barbadense]